MNIWFEAGLTVITAAVFMVVYRALKNRRTREEEKRDEAEDEQSR